jgi:hypothetical protein
MSDSTISEEELERVELDHYKDLHGNCALCEPEDGEAVPWPCPTLRLVHALRDRAYQDKALAEILEKEDGESCEGAAQRVMGVLTDWIHIAEERLLGATYAEECRKQADERVKVLEEALEVVDEVCGIVRRLADKEATWDYIAHYRHFDEMHNQARAALEKEK